MKRNFLKNISEWNSSPVLSVVGVTGAGKSSTVFNHLADKGFDKEDVLLVSNDSVSAYKGLDIGSSKPNVEHRKKWRIIGLDLFSIDEKSNLQSFINCIKAELLDHLKAGKKVIIVGGSHFYEQALVQGVRKGQANDETFQKSLDDLSGEEKWKRLNGFSKHFSQKIHCNDEFRLRRYLDLLERQGLTEADLLSPPRSVLSEFTDVVDTLVLMDEGPEFELNLKKRILEMFEVGWQQEFDKLVQSFGLDSPGLQTVGYRELVQYKQGHIESFDELLGKILISHRRLAKKQRTWLRSLLS